MPKVLPERPELGQLRRQAKELHRAAAAGDAPALARVRAVSDRIALASAQLALAREYGFASWPRLKAEVERKALISAGDVAGLARMVAAHPQLARERVSSCYSDDPAATALSYVGVARFHGVTDHDRAGEITRILLAAGASVEGAPGSPETPLITAASYGETEMARALIAAGADLEATGFAVPGGTALAHAVEFGNAEVVDVLVAAGAAVHDLAEAAGTGDLGGFRTADASPAELGRALRAAVTCERLAVIDRLLAGGVPVDADLEPGGTALHWAAYHGKAASVRRLLSHGADPNRRDADHDATPLGWCRHRQAELAAFADSRAHREVEAILEPLTTEG